jgi:hypothetical protein
VCPLLLLWLLLLVLWILSHQHLPLMLLLLLLGHLRSKGDRLNLEEWDSGAGCRLSVCVVAVACFALNAHPSCVWHVPGGPSWVFGLCC